MSFLRKSLLSALAASVLVVSSAPAFARPGHGGDRGWSRGGGHGGWGRHGGFRRHGGGWGRGHGGGWHRPGYRYYRGGGFDGGDFLLGALVVGGIALAVDAANRDRDYDRDDRDPDDGYRGERYPGRSEAPASGDRAAEDAAVDACAMAAEREAASRFGGDLRVDGIDHAQRDGAGWRVEGTLSVGDNARDGGSRGFVCGVRGEAVDFVQFLDREAIGRP